LRKKINENLEKSYKRTEFERKRAEKEDKETRKGRKETEGRGSTMKEKMAASSGLFSSTYSGPSKTK
jgi:hypothetical protein